MSEYSIDKKRIAFENIFRQLNLFKVTNKLRRRRMYCDYVIYRKMLHNMQKYMIYIIFVYENMHLFIVQVLRLITVINTAKT